MAKRKRLIPQDGYTVKWRNTREGGGKWKYARHEKNPNRGKVIKFPTRGKAAQWIRNHYVACWGVATIVHPCGKTERFEYWPHRESGALNVIGK